MDSNAMNSSTKEKLIEQIKEQGEIVRKLKASQSSKEKVKVKHLGREKDLLVLNDYLANASYLGGYRPTHVDSAMVEALNGPPWPCNVPHLERWFQHMMSFTAAERMSFLKGTLPTRIVALIESNNHISDFEQKVRSDVIRHNLL